MPNSRSFPRTTRIAIPDSFTDVEAAPLLCAGIIGYRALRRSALPPGGRLGIYGFGASAHLAAQVALHEGATVHVMTRAADAQRLARELGAASVQGATDEPPEKLDAAILFAPAGELVPVAMAALDRGGTLAVAGIHLTDIPRLHYQDAPVRGAPVAQRHREHATATARSCSRWRRRSRSGPPSCRTRSSRPIARSPTSPTTGSTGAAVLVSSG